MTKKKDCTENECEALSRPHLIEQKIQELTDSLEELNLLMKEEQSLKSFKGKKALKEAMADTKRLLNTTSKSKWFLEGMEPVDPIKMAKSAKRYNASVEKRRHEYNKANAGSIQALKNARLTS